MIEFNYYKNAKRHIVTFSYDDAPPEDYKLVKIFNKYGMKATFNVHSSSIKGGWGVKECDMKDLYKGHEVAVHTSNHPWLERCSNVTVINQVLENRNLIEKNMGYVVRGMAYPYGTYNDDVIKACKSCGIVYSRTAGETGDFKLPKDFMQWTGTCHHSNSKKYCDEFINSLQSPWASNLFYIWGHSFEFPRPDSFSFEDMEELCKRLAEHKDDIWFATNIEIYDYIMAQRALHISVDESFAYNPTNIDVWIAKDGKVYKIPAGETVTLD